MALAQGVGVLAGLNERTGGLLTRMALAIRQPDGLTPGAMPVEIRRFALTKLRHHRFFSPAELNVGTRLQSTSAATPSCKPNPAIFRAR
jgi:hypothetical protein